MTTQELLNIALIAVPTVLAASMLWDLSLVVRQCWRDSVNAIALREIAEVPETETELDNMVQMLWQVDEDPTPQPKTASIDWVESQESEEECEIPNIIDLAKARAAKFVPIIETQPQTPEAQAFEVWLGVAEEKPAHTTPRPDYSAMTVKQLRQEAKIRNVKNAGNMVKKDLVKALQAA